ncbi:3-dehydroquinate dehydratase [Pseudoprimorskyibacter insulae]|uniref:3-dehydroquinate dehydratase n=2 Tax=Pseudoprimorskyibacter insulae TaxID=1695997 RepID=A0A2R8AZR7_9RHOB|nr:3-dehydroquinate dehydratase [Pseudoprimorskyibacter insulae]
MSSLGRRSKKVYGKIASLDDLKQWVTDFGAGLGVDVETFSSNYQGAILEFIHESAERVDAYIINPAGLTTVGEGVRHALEDTGLPVMEVHFSNISANAGAARGLGGGAINSSFTHTATGLSMGMRHYSYAAALTALTLGLDDQDFLGAEAD